MHDTRGFSQLDYRDIIDWSLIKNNWSFIRKRETSRDTEEGEGGRKRARETLLPVAIT